MTTLYFLGDSHIDCVVRAAREKGVATTLGPLMNGGAWGLGEFQLREDGYIELLRPAPAHRSFDGAIGSNTSLFEIDGVIVTTVGFHTGHALAAITGVARDTSASPPPFISEAVFEECILAIRKRHFELIETLAKAGKTMVAYPPPPRHNKKLRAMAEQYDNIVSARYRAAGISVIDPRTFCLDDEGEFSKQFIPPRDLRHGNLAYGEAMLERILAALPDGGRSLERRAPKKSEALA